MVVILIVVDALGRVPKGLERGLEQSEIGGRSETIQIIALLRSTSLLRKVLET